MKEAGGLGKASLKANQRGSVWPCGEMMGRSLTVLYSLAAIERAFPSSGNRRFSSRIFIDASQPLRTSLCTKRQHRKRIKDLAILRTNGGLWTADRARASSDKKAPRRRGAFCGRGRSIRGCSNAFR